MMEQTNSENNVPLIVKVLGLLIGIPITIGALVLSIKIMWAGLGIVLPLLLIGLVVAVLVWFLQKINK